MEPTSDHRIDPNLAGRLLLELAQERSVEGLLAKLVHGVIQRPLVVCFQVWLMEQSGPSRSSPSGGHPAAMVSPPSLRLVAGLGRDASGQIIEGPPFFDPSLRIPLGKGLLGRAAAEGRQLVVADAFAQSAPEQVIDWLAEQQVRGWGGTPIKFKGEVLGVIAGYTRQVLESDAHMWGQVVADHIGAALANARAFEEIESLKAQLELQNTYLQEEVEEAKAFGSLVGNSAALRQIISQIDLVAPTDASVLILGETGTGKELVAHEIHRRSQRRDKPLVRVNCASVPRELYESEFFGHAKGAFTGAVRDRAGRFETASGGTLFLDEVGEIPLELQGKLLRVLQEKRYERVGEDRTRQTDVRLVGATNRDLKREVAAGRFRQDLYYRLHVFPIHVPPLRERVEDIPPLASHFVELSIRELRCPAPRLTRAAIAQLQAYDWPGNVRELRNLVQRAVILARGAALQFDLPVAGSPPSLPRRDTAGKPPFITEAEMRQRERDNLVAVLDAANWRVMGDHGAAELLGVRPTTLFSRIKKLGLKKPA